MKLIITAWTLSQKPSVPERAANVVTPRAQVKANCYYKEDRWGEISLFLQGRQGQ